MPTLAAILTDILEDVETSPERSPALDAALDRLTDFVQDHAQPIVLALTEHEAPCAAAGPEKAAEPLPPAAAPEAAVLRAFLRTLQREEGVTFVPQAVSKRGSAYVPLPCPAEMTEAQFQILLEAEIAAAWDAGEETQATVLERDLDRRRRALEAQARRDAQTLALRQPIRPLVAGARAAV